MRLVGVRRLSPCILALCVVGSGCSSSAEQGGPQLGDRPNPTPYEPETEPSIDPSLTTQQVGDFIAEIPGYVAALDPNGMIAAYQGMLAAHGDANCPALEVVESDGETTSVWEGECESTDGTTFRGEMYFSEYSFSEGDLTQARTSMYSFNLDITAQDGTFLRGAPEIEFSTEVFPGETNYALRFSGELAADSATAAGNPWLTGDLRGTVVAYAAEVDGGRFIGYGGGFTVPNDASVSALSFSEFGVFSFGCDGALGTISLRDKAGGWHDALYAAPVEDGDDLDPEQSCNACGDLSFYGESLGEFCSDAQTFSDLLTWETSPW